MQRLADGLGLPPSSVHDVTGWVRDWTGGHPYLSQRVCAELAEKPPTVWSPEVVEQVVRKLFLNTQDVDNNLKFVADWLTRPQNRVALLTAYYRLYRGQQIKADEKIGEDTGEKILEYLKLTGIVRQQNGALGISNRIYQTYFGTQWMDGVLREQGLITLKELEESLNLPPEPPPSKFQSFLKSAPSSATAERKPDFLGTRRLTFDEGKDPEKRQIPVWDPFSDRKEESQDTAKFETSELPAAPPDVPVRQIPVYDPFADDASPLSTPAWADDIPGWFSPERLVRRLDEPEETEEAPEDVPTPPPTRWQGFNQWAASLRIMRGWNYDLSRAGYSLSVGEYLLLRAGAAGAAALVLLVLRPGDMLLTLAGMVIGWFAPAWFGDQHARQRLEAFQRQLPDTLSLWVNALRSGYSVLQSFEALAKDQPEPSATEFRRVVQEVQIGVDLSDALDHMLNRVQSDDLDLAITAVNIQREVGGNLAEILDVIGFTIRERLRLAGEVASRWKSWFIPLYVLAAVLVALQNTVFAPYFVIASEHPAGQVGLVLAYLLMSLLLVVSKQVSINRAAAALALGSAPLMRTLWNALFLFIVLGVLYLLNVPLPYLLGLLVLGILRPLWSTAVIAGIVVTAVVLGTIPFASLTSLTLIGGDPVMDWAQVVFVLLVIAGVALVGGLLLWAVPRLLRRFQPRDPLAQRLADYSETLENLGSLQEVELTMSFQDRVLTPLFNQLGQMVGRFTPQRQVENMSRQLERSGLYDTSVERFLLVRMVWSVGTAVVAALALSWLTAALLNTTMMSWYTVLYAAGGAALGYLIPAWQLARRIARRREQVEEALPDALDLLMICVEAGLGFDQAMGKVYEKWDNELSIAFGRVLREIQLGKLRRDALRAMAERLDTPGIRTFAAAITQADQLGVSIAKVLRVQSDQLRTQRRQARQSALTDNDLAMSFAINVLLPITVTLWLIAPLVARLLG